MNAPLTVTVREAATGPVLEVAGELDYATVGELRDLLPTLALRPGRRLVLDLTAMEFCDSSGIAVLIAARNAALAADADIALAGVPEHTLRVLRVVGLDQIFAVHPDSRTATQA